MTDSQPHDILPEWSQQQILNFNNDDSSIYSDPLAFVNISSVDWDFVDSNLLPIDSTTFDDSDELLFGKTSKTSSTNQNETLDCQLFTDLPFDSILDQIFLESPKISDGDNDQAIQNIYDQLKADVTPITDHRPEPQSVIDAIFVNEVPTMSWICQPPANHRFRYSTDGIRYLESSRLNPPAVELPNLSHIHLAANQSFAVQLALVTTDDNPGGKSYLHEYELLYNGDDAIQVDSALVRLPLTDKDISSRIKKFRKIRIIKKKHLQYKYQLIPHDPLVPGNEPEEYVQPTGRRMTKPKQAKLFDKLYHTDQCRIICQLMFRDGENWYTTELFCQTGIITNGGTADDE